MPRKKKSERQQARQLALFLVTLLAVLGGLFWYRGYPRQATTAMTGAAAVGLCALLARGVWLRLFRRWMKLAAVLSWVSTGLLLTVFFYGVLTPLALLMRLAGRKPLDLDWKDGKPTYWIEKTPVETTLARYQKQF